MLISGVFITGASNVLFGLLDRIDDLPTFTAYCFVVRIFEALGAAAFSTASYTIIMQVFPDNIGTAFVSTFYVLILPVLPIPPLPPLLQHFDRFQLQIISSYSDGKFHMLFF